MLSAPTRPGSPVQGQSSWPENLGYAGRPVLVSRKCSGKTLADHRADRKAWLVATLGLLPADESGYRRERMTNTDSDDMPLTQRRMHVLAERFWALAKSSELSIARPASDVAGDAGRHLGRQRRPGMAGGTGVGLVGEAGPGRPVGTWSSSRLTEDECLGAVAVGGRLVAAGEAEGDFGRARHRADRRPSPRWQAGWRCCLAPDAVPLADHERAACGVRSATGAVARASARHRVDRLSAGNQARICPSGRWSRLPVRR